MQIEILIIKIRQSCDCLIFIMEICIPEAWIIATDPWAFIH